MSLVDNISSVITAIGQQFVGVHNLINANTQAIANLATAQGSFGTVTPQIITTTESPLIFSVVTASTDSNIMTINDVNDSVSYLVNASYNFRTDMTFEVGTSQTRTITIRGRNLADGTLVYSRTITINQANNTTKTTSTNTLLTIGSNGYPEAPLTIYFTIQADGTGIAMSEFETIITSSNEVSTSSANIFATTTKTSNYTATVSDYTIRVDCSANNVDIILPPAGTTGLVLVIKRIDSSSFNCNILGTIDGGANAQINKQYTSLQLQANGTSWDIL